VAFAFGDHLLDVDRRELRRGGAPVALESQVFDLLVYLVRNRGRVVPAHRPEDYVHVLERLRKVGWDG